MSKLEQKAEYEGKAKLILPTKNPDEVIQSFKNDATAFNGVKKESFEGKGQLNNAFSCHFFDLLRNQGVETHFIGRLSETDMLVKRLKIVPIEFVVRNVVAGSLLKRTGLPEGQDLKSPIVETYYKSDSLGDPMLAKVHIDLLELISDSDLKKITEMALHVNSILKEAFKSAGFRLVDIKMEFGFDSQGNLLLGDEISPDVCRIWAADTQQKFDKDVFRLDLADLIDTYKALAERLHVNV